MKKLKPVLLLSLSILLMVSTLPSCNLSSSESASSNTSQSVSDQPETLDIYGTVCVDKTEQIVIDFPAKVSEVYVKDGEEVLKGAKLLTLDYEDYKLEIKTRENEIRMDEIELKQLKANVNPQMLEASKIQEELEVKKSYLETGNDPDLLPLQNSLKLLEDAVAMARNDHKANEDLFNQGLISEEEFMKSKQNLESREKELQDTLTAIEKIKTNRRLEVNALSSALNATKIQSANTDNQKVSSINVLEVKIETAKLLLESMQNKLNKPYIKDNDIIASEDNLIIYDINCIKGSDVNSGYGPVLKMMYKDTLYILADIPEESISLVQIGDTAKISLSDKNIGEITGKVTKISNRAVEKNGDTVIEAIILVEQGKELLKPGLSADISIIINSSKE